MNKYIKNESHRVLVKDSWGISNSKDLREGRDQRKEAA